MWCTGLVRRSHNWPADIKLTIAISCGTLAAPLAWPSPDGLVPVSSCATAISLLKSRTLSLSEAELGLAEVWCRFCFCFCLRESMSLSEAELVLAEVWRRFCFCLRKLNAPTAISWNRLAASSVMTMSFQSSHSSRFVVNQWTQTWSLVSSNK